MDWRKELDAILAHSAILNKFSDISLNGIVLYGAGSMGEMALDFLETISVKPKYIVDKNFQGTLRGINVIFPEDIPDKDLDNLTFVICIVSVAVNPIYKYLASYGCKDIRHFYDYSELYLKNQISNGWSYYNPTLNDTIAMQNVCKSLEHNECSFAHYLQFLWWRLRRIEHVYKDCAVLSNKKYFKAPCMPQLTGNERFLDAGAHFGTTTRSFLEATNGQYKSILAIEPDENNLKIMRDNLNKISDIKYQQIALSDKNEHKNFRDALGFASKIEENGNKIVQTQTIDSLNINPTIIKLHIEGHELQALEGAKVTIKKERPILMVLADHNEDGLYEIAKFLMALENYTLYFYLHDYCGNSAIYYAIPDERCRI